MDLLQGAAIEFEQIGASSIATRYNLSFLLPVDLDFFQMNWLKIATAPFFPDFPGAVFELYLVFGNCMINTNSSNNMYNIYSSSIRNTNISCDEARQ